MTLRIPNDKKVTKLDDLEVHEVSIVDRPANQRTFLLVKSESGEPRGEEIQTDSVGNLVSVQDTVAEPEPESTEKRLAVGDEMRKEMFDNLGGIIRSLDTIMMVTDFSDFAKADDGPTDLEKLLAKELKEAAGKLSNFAENLPVNKADEDNTMDLGEFKKSLAQLQERLTKVSQPEPEQPKEEEASAQPEATQKSEEVSDKLEASVTVEVPEEVTKALESFNATTEKLVKTVEAQRAEIAELKKAAPTSQVLPVEEAPEAKNKDDDPGYWPDDMNGTDPAVSF